MERLIPGLESLPDDTAMPPEPCRLDILSPQSLRPEQQSDKSLKFEARKAPQKKNGSHVLWLPFS
jgi:hypothetical protein